MKVRFVRDYLMYQKGEIITPNKPIREILLQRGLIEIVEGEEDGEAEPETASVEASEKAVKKRGRPRKLFKR